MTHGTAGSETRLGAALRARPLTSAIGLEIAFDVLVVVGALVLSVLLPGLPGYSVTGPSQSLLLVAVTAAVALALVAALRWWRFSGFTPRSEWRDMRLYWVPVVLLAIPLLAGLKPIAPATVALLLLAYVLTAVFEETMWRGLLLGLLRPLGIWPAVLISSVLFGLGHLGNSLLRGVSLMILLQAFGAAVQGIGLAALRLRTNSIWPLIAIHALHDLFLQAGRLPIALADAVVATILAVYGIVLLRRRRLEDLPSSTPLERGALAT
jgi:membrane protease YdiL (CAAX protease family)